MRARDYRSNLHACMHSVYNWSATYVVTIIGDGSFGILFLILYSHTTIVQGRRNDLFLKSVRVLVSSEYLFEIIFVSIGD